MTHHTHPVFYLFNYFCILQESSCPCAAFFYAGDCYDVDYDETAMTHFTSLLNFKFLLIFMVSRQETPKSGSANWDVLNTEGMWW